MGLEQLRDHLDLRMVTPSQPCRIEGSDGRYVVGELVHGHVFRDLARNRVATLPTESLDETETEEEEAEPMVAPDPPAASNPAPVRPDPAPIENNEAPDPGEGEEIADASPRPLWSRHPSILAFPLQITATILLAASVAVVWRFDWSGSLTAALASLTVFSLSLLLWRKTANHLQIFPDFIVIRSGTPWRRRRVLPRDEIQTLAACRHGLSRWVGLGCVEIRTCKDRVFRLPGYRRTRKAEKLWRQGTGA